nr:uncharacterized protein LOC124813576 [Hydra vulgaris]
MEFTKLVDIINQCETERYEIWIMKDIVIYTPLTCIYCMLLMVSAKPSNPVRIKNGGEIGISTISLLQYEGNCRRITVKRHFGNKERSCSTLKRVKVGVCVGTCILPQSVLNQYPNINYKNLTNIIDDYKRNTDCVEVLVKHKKIEVYCSDDNTITEYKVKNVKSCMCKNKLIDMSTTLKTFTSIK